MKAVTMIAAALFLSLMLAFVSASILLLPGRIVPAFAAIFGGLS